MSTDRDNVASNASSAQACVRDEEFRDFIRDRARDLLDLASYVAVRQHSRATPTRALLGSLMFKAAQLVELLDEFGARHNSHWCRFRVLASTIKSFARISYGLAHLLHALPGYRLLPVDGDFAAATVDQLHFANRVITTASANLLKEATLLGVLLEARPPPQDEFRKPLLSGRLANDRVKRHVGSAAAIVTQLATDFLNLAAESELLHTSARVRAARYVACFPDAVSEERLRLLTFRFHNLQSLYDTHVAGTKVETLDAGLATLRGHVSAIFHLLESATDLAHFYERHLSPQTGDAVIHLRPVVEAEATLTCLFGYTIAYSSSYLSGGERLCQEMLRRYAEFGRIEVPVPNYRGFHVRPSNLVARIARHYGSEVRMELDGDTYDAGSPLELFRANEKINAHKRRWLAQEIAKMSFAQDTVEADAICALVLDVVRRLAEQGKLVLYRQPVKLSDELTRREGGALACVVAEIGHLQATGQVDIRTDLTVALTGDKRVLADIDLLAREGYGEDSFGNNTMLPKALAYLHRQLSIS